MESGVTLFLMTEKGYRFLEAIFPKFGKLIKKVITAEDKAIEDDYFDNIVQFCNENLIEVNKKKECEIVNTEFAMAISWRWLIDHPEKKLIVFHDSLLPRFRGFAPLVNSLIKGEVQIGVTALLGAKDYDRGAVLCQFASNISYPIKIQEAIQFVVKDYIRCGEYIFTNLSLGIELVGKPQDESRATYSPWRDMLDYKINWSCSSHEIRRFVDALGYPYGGARAQLNGREVKILEVEEYDHVNVELIHPGKVLFLENGFPIVICGKGLVKIKNASYVDSSIGEAVFPFKGIRKRFE